MKEERGRVGFLDRAKALFNPDQWRGGAYAGEVLDSMPMGFTGFEGNYKSYLDIYRGSFPVRMVVSFRANNTAALPLKVYRKIDAETREALMDHELSTVLEDPNPEDTRHTFIRDLSTDLDLFDVTFWWKRRIAGKLILTRLYPDAIQVMGDSWAPDAFREFRPNGTTIDHPRSDVLWLHGYGGRRGISPMETLRQTLAEDDAESRGRQGMARNQWRSTGVIERPKDAPEWDDTGRDRFLEQMQSRYGGGENAGKPLLLEEGMTWKSDAMTQKSAEYVAARSLTLNTVCWTFHTAPALLGVEGAPYGSMTEYNRQLYTNVLAPRLDFLEQGLNKQLVRSDFLDSNGVYVEFSLEGKLRGSFAEQAEVATTALAGKAWMTVVEMRARMNLPALSAAELEIMNPPAPEVEGGRPAEPGAGGEPRPSDPIGQRNLGQKAQITADEMLALRNMFEAGTRDKVADFHIRQQVSVEADGKFDLKRWNQELSGLLHMTYMEITGYFGRLAAEKIGGKYDEARTVNFWVKVSKDQANGMNQNVRDAKGSNEERFASAIAGSGSVAQAICTKASGWAVLEAAKQNAGKSAVKRRIKRTAQRDNEGRIVAVTDEELD